MRRSFGWLLLCAACSAGEVPDLPDAEDLEEVWDGPGDPEGPGMEGVTEAHNKVRRPLGIPELVYSEEMAVVSAEWLEHLENNEGCDIEHDWSSPLGENLYWSTAGAGPAVVVKAWADEVEDYDYDSNTCEPGRQCGHYTQIVWSTTTIVGCASRRCAQCPEIWMCNYDPAGNRQGRRPY